MINEIIDVKFDQEISPDTATDVDRIECIKGKPGTALIYKTVQKIFEKIKNRTVFSIKCRKVARKTTINSSTFKEI